MDFDFSIKTQADYNQFVQFLKSVSKNETIEDHERHVKILNTKQKVIAIAMALIRKTAHKNAGKRSLPCKSHGIVNGEPWNECRQKCRISEKLHDSRLFDVHINALGG